MRSKKLIAFHGDIKIKQKYVARVKRHYELDEIIQGTYWQNGKGCAVGCTVEQSDSPHKAMEDELGIPRMIASLEDRIFEGLSNGEAKEFPLKFLKAIKPGADLSLVVPKFFVWLLTDPKDGVIRFARPDGKIAIQRVADLYQKKIDGKSVSEATWRYAATAADAAAYAATAAAYADAAYAAAAAADAAAFRKVKGNHYAKMAVKLISILKATK
jgi:hypothetical protein